MTQEALERRFPLAYQYPPSPATFTFSGNGVNHLQNDQRARTLRQVTAELEVILAGDDAKHRPSVALAAVAEAVAQWRAVLEAKGVC